MLTPVCVAMDTEEAKKKPQKDKSKAEGEGEEEMEMEEGEENEMDFAVILRSNSSEVPGIVTNSPT